MRHKKETKERNNTNPRLCIRPMVDDELDDDEDDCGLDLLALLPVWYCRSKGTKEKVLSLLRIRVYIRPDGFTRRAGRRFTHTHTHTHWVSLPMKFHHHCSSSSSMLVMPWDEFMHTPLSSSSLRIRFLIVRWMRKFLLACIALLRVYMPTPLSSSTLCIGFLIIWWMHCQLSLVVLYVRPMFAWWRKWHIRIKGVRFIAPHHLIKLTSSSTMILKKCLGKHPWE